MILTVDTLNECGRWIIAHLGRMSIELAILAGVVFATLHLLRVKSPAIRHAFWGLLLAKPVVTFLVASPLSLYGFLLSSMPESVVSSPAPQAGVEATNVLPHLVRSEPFSGISSALRELPAPRIHGLGIDVYGASMIAWLAVAGFLGIRLILGCAYVAFLRSTTVVQRKGPFAEIADEASRALRMKPGIRVATSRVAHGPVLAGVLRPLILLPDSMADKLTRKQLKLVIMHELVHARRRDNLVLLIQRLAEMLLFFHPVVWLCGWMMRREAEAACDDAVIDASEEADGAAAYADSLTCVAEMRCGITQRLLINTFAAAESNFGRRVRRILDGKRGRMTIGLTIATAAALILIAVFGLPSANSALLAKPASKEVMAVREAYAEYEKNFPPTELEMTGYFQLESFDADVASMTPNDEATFARKGIQFWLDTKDLKNGKSVYEQIVSTRDGRELDFLFPLTKESDKRDAKLWKPAYRFPFPDMAAAYAVPLTRRVKEDALEFNGKSESVDGAACQVFEGKAKEAPNALHYKLYLDPAIGMMPRMIEEIPGEKNARVRTRISLKEYTEIAGGIWMPKRQEIESGLDAGKRHLNMHLVRSLSVKPDKGYDIFARRELGKKAEASSSSGATSADSSSKFVAKIPGQGSVEIVSIRAHGAEDKSFWLPDGTPLDEPPYAEFDGEVSGDGNAYEFALRMSGFASPTYMHEYMDQGRGPIASAGGSASNAEGKPVSDLQVSARMFSEKRDGCDIRLRCASREWKPVVSTEAEGASSYGGDGYHVAFSEPYENDNKVCVTATVSDRVRKKAFRVVAVDSSGVVHEAAESGAGGDDKFLQATYKFADLKRDDVKEFRLEACDWIEVEFKNIALAKGKHTDFRVVGPTRISEEASSEEEQNAEERPSEPGAGESSRNQTSQALLPEKKAAFDALYSLKDGEILKRVAPPLSPERDEWLKANMNRIAPPPLPEHSELAKEEGIKSEPPPVESSRFVLMEWDGGIVRTKDVCGSNKPCMLLVAMSLTRLGISYFFHPQNVDMFEVPGDWIVRKGASTEEILNEFAKILRHDFGKEIKFEHREEEEEVVVASGTYKFTPLDGVDEREEIHFFADVYDAQKSTFDEEEALVPAIAHVLERWYPPRIIDETTPSKEELRRIRVHPLGSFAKAREDVAKSHDLTEGRRLQKLFLDNVSKQSGIAFQTGIRVVPTWRIDGGYRAGTPDASS